MNKPSDITKLVLKNSKKQIAFKTIISILYRAIVMLIPILISQVVTDVTAGHYERAIYISLAAIAIVIVYRMVDILNTFAWHKLYNRLYENYTMIGETKVFDNSLYSLSRFNVGEFLNIMSTDINIMSDFISNLIMRIIRIIEVIIIFFYFFMIDIYMGLASVIMTAISLVVIILSSKRISNLNEEKSIKFDERNTIVNEFLLSIREIKSFNIFEPMKKRIDDSTKKYTNSYLKQRVGEDAYKFAILAFIEVCRWGLVIYSIYLIANDNLEVGTLLIVYNYFAQLVDGFSEFTCINIGISQLSVAQSRFFELIIYSHEKKEIANKYNLIDYNIEFDKVLYGDKTAPTLKGTSFKIKGNAINTFSGLEDCGKSGVVDLLLKLNSQHSGTIKIDGVPINEIGFDSYYNIVSSIDIDDNFLNISVKDNLSIMNDDLNRIVYICKKLGIHDEISKLKYGYDTIVNSEDDKLKPNTKLLLNIVRILLKNTRIMIFDEVLSSLNNSDREKVIAELIKIKKEHTIIIIDNDSDILEISDNIILLDEGKVHDRGNYKKISESELFKRITTE